MKIILIRHGETDWNRAGKIQGITDIPLNGAGREQASRLALLIAEKYPSVTAIYTSTLLRASETGEIIAKRLGVPCAAIPGLEELRFGAFEGGSWSDAKRCDPAAYAALNAGDLGARAPGGESYSELLHRAAAALRAIAERETGDVAVVSHGALIRCLTGYLNGGGFSEADFKKIRNGSVHEIDPAALARVL